MMHALTLVLNAGGQSRRMGTNKALLPVPPHGVPLVVVLAARLQALAPAQTYVVSDDEAVRQVVTAAGVGQVLHDRFPGGGPLSGIATGLARADDWIVTVACDMPLLNPTVLLQLYELTSDEWDAVVPFVNDRYQTMHALYHPRCLPAIQRAVEQGRLRAVSFYDDVRVRTVPEAHYRRFDPHARSLVNVNTPEEWAAIVGEVAA